MADATTPMGNAERAHDFVREHIDCPRCHSKAAPCAACADAAEHLERMLNEAENRGAEQEEPTEPLRGAVS